MYKCFVCHEVSPPGQPRLVHTIHRLVPRFVHGNGELDLREEIARELPVCASCKAELDAGIALDVLLEGCRPLILPTALPPSFFAPASRDAEAPPQTTDF